MAQLTPHYSSKEMISLFVKFIDDIIFGLTNEGHCKEFSELISKEFEMSMIDILLFSLAFMSSK